jgi:hypothetical protein
VNLTTSDGLEAAQKFRAHIARGGEIAQGRFNLEKVRKPHPITELLQRYHKHAASYKASYSGEKYVIEGLKKYFSGRYLSDVTTWAVEKSVAGHVFLRGPHAPQRRGR